MIVFVPAYCGDDALRQIGHRLLFAGFRIEKMEYSEAVFVGNEGDQVAVIGERELVYVPGNVAGEIRVRL